MLDTTGWEADAQDLPSIGTLHARAFHPKNEWHRKNFPASMAPWWSEKYAVDIAEPASLVLKMASPDSSTTVLGLLCLRRYKADERGAPCWTAVSPPSQMDKNIFDAMINSMIEYRERFMLGRDHFCVEHFGVDDRYQGHGFGKTLLERACKIADEEKLDMFVEANEFAERFYEKFGFKTEETLEMPGGMKEKFLVRRSGTQSESRGI